MGSIGHIILAVNTICGMALALTDGDYTDNLSQSFCLSWLGFASGFGQGLSKIVLYNIFECQTLMNMPFNNNTFTDKSVGQKQPNRNPIQPMITSFQSQILFFC